jgi:type IV fimbrial biogenesis protein FimT
VAFGMTKTRGFSLIELMITIAVAAIILALAAPAFTDTISKKRVSAETSDLLGDLALARSESLTRGARVVLCPSNTGTGCTSTAWNLGRIIFVDTDPNGTVDTGETILRVGAPLDAASALTVSGGSVDRISYLPSGAISDDSRNALTVCRSGYKGRSVAINPMGQIHVTQTSSTCS